jgi:hypothetical protein
LVAATGVESQPCSRGRYESPPGHVLPIRKLLRHDADVMVSAGDARASYQVNEWR